MRGLSDDEGQRLLRIVRRSSGSVVTSWRAQLALLSAPDVHPDRDRDGDVHQRRASTVTARRGAVDRVRGVIHSLDTHGVDSLRPRCAKARWGRTEFLRCARYLRRLYPHTVRIAIVPHNVSPHLTVQTDDRVGRWAQRNNVEPAYVRFYGL